MSHKNMNINELAALLGSDYHRLTRMAQKGHIPSQTIRGEFRFNTLQICAWLQEILPTLEHSELLQIDTGIGQHRGASYLTPMIAPLLKTQAVTCDLDARTQNSVKRKLVALADTTACVYDSETLLDNLTCYALPCSATLVHPNKALPYALAEPVMAVAKTLGPVLCGHHPRTNVFFLCAAQDQTHHLHLLARVCRLLQDNDLVNQLHEAQTPLDIIEAITEAEDELTTSAV
ncbi:MAG: PTS sugar transporter subunit IIA [Phycisphaerae bacterium]|nr:PTS sugar transporter subunit IIA [Phycisphaerae bacterium]